MSEPLPPVPPAAPVPATLAPPKTLVACRLCGDPTEPGKACPSCGAKFVTNRDGDWLRCG